MSVSPSVFQVGDVVQLRSGGARMTVEQVQSDQVACTWFEGKKLERAIFVAGVLIKYQSPKIGIVRTRF